MDKSAEDLRLLLGHARIGSHLGQRCDDEKRQEREEQKMRKRMSPEKLTGGGTGLGKAEGVPMP